MRDYSRMNLINDMTSVFENIFNSGDEADKFLFIQKYLRLIEEMTGDHVNIFFTHDPFKTRENVKITDMDKRCMEYLLEKVRTTKQKLYHDTPSSQAHAFLGIAYEIGAFGIKRNIEKAITFYISASKQNNALGTYRLAECFEKGLGGVRNMVKAMTYYRCAAKLGGIEAMHIYGVILLNGADGIRKDTATGLVYLKMAVKSANRNYPYPFYDLAKCYDLTGNVSDIHSDLEYAFYLYHRGAQLGDPNCQYRIATIFDYGEMGKEKDLEQAVYWYNNAAELGQIDAMYHLAHFKCSGVEGMLDRNYEDAYSLALCAASKGNVDSAFLVAEYIEMGIGVQQDTLHALWWYTIAKYLGCEKATIKIDQLKKHVNATSTFSSSPTGCRIM